ncbi:serine/threonine-protein phosphatase 4 catalytic subunit [Pancytospora philotis]|nr:serine/threonine-protein phosphatase 4 catalytic subunit [Pancytospora philotis]
MDYGRVLANLRDLVLPTREEALAIIEAALGSLLGERNIVCVQAPVNIVGDLHGQFFDFLHMLDVCDGAHGFLFLGDYVDRGYNSVELLLYTLVMRLQRPVAVHMLRGNHENRAQTSAYGFRDECLAKYDEIVYWKMCELFEALPLAAAVQGGFFCMHGGITPDLCIDELLAVDRLVEYPRLGSIMWSDPSDDVDDYVPSQRGAGYLFGRMAVADFLLQLNDAWPAIACPAAGSDADMRFRAIVRSHQLVMEGIKEHFGGACITVWSAPNYCYKCQNRAAVMVVEPDGHDYVYYDRAEEQFRQAGAVPVYFNGKS